MKNKVLLLVAALVALALFTSSTAVAAESMKIGIVNLKQCIDESKVGKAKKEELRAKTEGMDKKLGEFETEARAIAEEIKNQQMLLSETLKAEKARRFEELRMQAQQIQKQKQQISDDLTKMVLSDIGKVINKISEEGGYDMVITEGGPWLLYAKPALDMTAEVIAALDAQ